MRIATAITWCSTQSQLGSVISAVRRTLRSAKIEAASLDEFEEIMLDAAPELILANH